MPEDPSRLTIDKVDLRQPMDEWKLRLADRGKRRHLSYFLDFDTRANLLKDIPGPLCSAEAKTLHSENQRRVLDGLRSQFGIDQFDTKVANFIEIGSKPFSIISYHNYLYDQVRHAFIVGSYYPALLGACALGERTLNHLILDLREQFRHTSAYKKIHSKKSFANWPDTINILQEWGVLLPKAASEFSALAELRNRSVHFNAASSHSLRTDALAAVIHMREIIGEQFSAWGHQPWFIEGTFGHIFIKRDWEENPFIKTFYLKSCPLVGPHFTISLDDGLTYFDHHDYGDGDWTDDEFAKYFNDRKLEQLAGPFSA